MANKITQSQKNEYQIQHFGFSARGFVNFYYNILIECWAAAIDQKVIPLVTKKSDRPEKVQALRDKLMGRIFQNGKLDLILKNAQTYLGQYVFFIPANVTLPSNLPNFELKEDDEEQIMATIHTLENEIKQLRRKLEVVKRKRQAVDEQ